MFPEKYFLIPDYQPMELLGVTGLFTNLRVDRSSLPDGFYKYSIREGEDDFLSSIKNDVLVNHMGDFICRKELDLKGTDELDLLGDYSFTGEKVNLDAFFGEDIKAKIAEELDSFAFAFDPYEYLDNIPTGGTREAALEEIRAGLSDKDYVDGMISYFKKILDDHKSESFLDRRTEQKVYSFVSVLMDINAQNRDGLDAQIVSANKVKAAQANAEVSREPEIQ